MNRFLPIKQKIPLSDTTSAKGEKLSRYHLFSLLPLGKKPHGTRSCPLRCNGRSRHPYPTQILRVCSRCGSRKEFTRDSWLLSHRRQLSWHESSDLLVSGHRQFSPIIIDCREFVKGFCEFSDDFQEKILGEAGKIRLSRLSASGYTAYFGILCRTAQKNIVKLRKIPQNIVKKHLQFKEKCVILLLYNSRVR